MHHIVLLHHLVCGPVIANYSVTILLLYLGPSCSSHDIGIYQFIFCTRMLEQLLFQRYAV